MLHAGVDAKSVVERGGWKDVATVVKHHAHAMTDPTATEVIFDTNLTQGETRDVLSFYNNRKKLK